MLIAEIRVAHEASRGTYGAPRIHAELAAKGIRVGRKRIARLMLQAGLAGVSRRRFVTTTVRDGGRPAPDLVERNFTAEAPDRLWVADITYIPTWAGFLYLAVVLDAYSRRIVGWSMATTTRQTTAGSTDDVGRGTRQLSAGRSPCNAPRNWLTSSSERVQFGSLGLAAGWSSIGASVAQFGGWRPAGTERRQK